MASHAHDHHHGACSSSDVQASGSGVCPICLDYCVDPRLLPCLHTACRACIDRVSATAGRSQRRLKCLVCKTNCILPAAGAIRLRTNPRASRKRKVDCVVCSNEECKAWCSTCDVFVCNEHGMEHMSTPTSSGAAKHLFEFYKTPEEARQSVEQSSSKTIDVCPEHDQPLLYLCKDCNTPVCGGCCAIGDHKGHNTARASAIALEKKFKVSGDIAMLRTSVEPRLVKSVRAVDDVTSKLTRNTAEARGKIEAAVLTVVNTVQACGQKLLQDVNDLELTRTKDLNQQRDGLQHQLDAARGASSFGYKVIKEMSEDNQACLGLLVTVEERIDSISREKIEDEPKAHADIDFQSPPEDTLVRKAMKIIGRLISHNASAAHSSVEGGFLQECTVNSTFEMSIVCKDAQDKKIPSHTDIIKTRWVSRPRGATLDPVVEIDASDRPGCYRLCCRVGVIGEYQLHVEINGVGMLQPVTLHVSLQHFDRRECNAEEISVSSDQHNATRAARGVWHSSSVLGGVGMRHGWHSWNIQIGSTPNIHVLGIASKPLHRTRDNLFQSFIWANHGMRYGDGHDDSNPVEWKANEILEFELDCDQHTFRMTVPRSGESRAICNLPEKEFFVYANMFYEENSVTFV